MNGYVQIPNVTFDKWAEMTGLKGHHLGFLIVILSKVPVDKTTVSIPMEDFTPAWGTLPRVRKLVQDLEEAGCLAVTRSPPHHNIFDVAPFMAKIADQKISGAH